MPSIIPRHHELVPAYTEGRDKRAHQPLPLGVSATLDHTHHEVRGDEMHGIRLPAEFDLGHVTVEVYNLGGRAELSVTDTETGATFRTLPNFIKHLRDIGYDGVRMFYVEE